jgi:hypothetical protein
MAARRFLAVAHIIIGVLLMPLVALFALVAAPILLIGPIWGVMLGIRLWRGDGTVLAAVRWTHVIYLGIDALLMAYGAFALRAAEQSAARGGGLMGGFGLMPLGAGILLAGFSILTLALARPRTP